MWLVLQEVTEALENCEEFSERRGRKLTSCGDDPASGVQD